MALLEVRTEWAVYKDCFLQVARYQADTRQSNRDMEQRGRTYRKNHGMHCRKRTCRGRDSDRHE